MLAINSTNLVTYALENDSTGEPVAGAEVSVQLFLDGEAQSPLFAMDDDGEGSYSAFLDTDITADLIDGAIYTLVFTVEAGEGSLVDHEEAVAMYA